MRKPRLYMELNRGLILSTCLELRFNFDALDRMEPWFKPPSGADLILTYICTGFMFPGKF